MNDVRVGREAGATSELLITGGADNDGVLHGSQAGGVQRAHVENVNTLHLAQNFQTLQTGRLLEVGGDSAGSGTRAEQIFASLDLCTIDTMLAAFLSSRFDRGYEVGVRNRRDARVKVLYDPIFFSATPARAAACSLGVVGPLLAASPEERVSRRIARARPGGIAYGG